MPSAFENPREIYSTNANYLENWDLVEFTVQEKKDVKTSIVSDATYIYYIQVPRLQYQFSQTVKLTFTDRQSYAAAQREPPTSVSAMTDYARGLSLVNLPNAIAPVTGAFYSGTKINDWLATGHTFRMLTDGIFEVQVHMEAYSDFIWDRTNACRTQMLKATNVTATSPEV